MSGNKLLITPVWSNSGRNEKNVQQSAFLFAIIIIFLTPCFHTPCLRACLACCLRVPLIAACIVPVSL